MARQIPLDLIADALDNAAFDEDCIREDYPYTGGHTCPAVVLPSHNDYDRFIVELARLSDDQDGTYNQVVDWMIGMCSRDSMGRSKMVFFWPYLEFTDGESE